MGDADFSKEGQNKMGDPNPAMHGMSFKAKCEGVAGNSAAFVSLPGDESSSAVLYGEYAAKFKAGDVALVSFQLAPGNGDLGRDRADKK